MRETNNRKIYTDLLCQETCKTSVVPIKTVKDIKAQSKCTTHAVEAIKARNPNRVLGAAAPDVNDQAEREMSRQERIPDNLAVPSQAAPGEATTRASSSKLDNEKGYEEEKNTTCRGYSKICPE